ncbi:hypothetical protein V8E36_004210 [Tilletia maclaganii]
MPSKAAYAPLGHDGIHRPASQWGRRRIFIILSVIAAGLLLFSFIWPPSYDNIKSTAQSTFASKTDIFKKPDVFKNVPDRYPWTGAGKPHPLSNESVLMIKTGHSVIYDRVPSHLVWPRPDIPNRYVYSDVALEIGEHQIIDALANASALVKAKSEYKEYLRLNNLFRNHAPISPAHDGWMLDKWKFAPMTAHSWRTNPDAKWFVTIDGDTYLFWGTLMRWLAQNFDPKKNIYLGYDEIGYGAIKYFFAHGGAGYVMSKQLMDELFLDDPEGLKLEAKGEFNGWPCGDCALGVIIGQMPTRGKHLDGGADLFQHDGFDVLIWRKRLWHSYLISLHHNTAANLMDLREFEEKLLPTLPDWDGVRYCDLWEGFAPEFIRKPYAEYKSALERGIADPASELSLKKSVVQKDWKSGDVDKTSCDWNCAKQLGRPFDVAHCEAFCEANPKCMGWLMSKTDCTLSINGWRVGKAAGSNEDWTSGWRLDRIAAIEREMPCRNATLRRDADERGHGVGAGRGSLENTGLDDGWVLPPKGVKNTPPPLPEEEDKKKAEEEKQKKLKAEQEAAAAKAKEAAAAVVVDAAGGQRSSSDSSSRSHVRSASVGNGVVLPLVVPAV